MLIIACSGSGLPPPQDVSGLSSDSHAAEDEIAVAPDGTIVIAWIEIGTSQGISYRVSTDGGQTFGAKIGMTFPGAGLGGSDPALTVDAQGNFYAAFLGVAYTMSGPAFSRVYVAKAAAGTGVFGPAVEISEPNNTTAIFDHPEIFVTSTGAILVGYANYATAAGTSQGIVARSTDGSSWSRSVAIDVPETANLLWFCEGAGNEYLTYLGANTTEVFAGLRTSTDDGMTWSSPSVHASLDTDMVGEADSAAWRRAATSGSSTRRRRCGRPTRRRSTS